MKERPEKMLGARVRLWPIVAWPAAVLIAVAAAQAGSYSKTLGNNYHAQSTDYYCGPASIQMMLDSDTVGHINKTQDEIFAKVRTYNTDNTNWYTDPNGLKGTVQFYDPAHTYLTYYHDSLSSANRKLAYNLDKYNVPASVLIYGGKHWIDVRGVWTINMPWQGSAKPQDDGTYYINGFYIRDPWDKWNGLGHDRFLWNLPGGWQTFFTKVTGTSAPGSPWINKYTTVADPDPIADGDTTLAPSLPGPNMLTASEAASRAWTILNTEDDEGYKPLMEQYGFSIVGGYFSSSEAFTLDWYENGRTDWIVPFVDPSIMAPEHITGAMVIDAWTGDPYQATWIDPNDTPNSHADLYSLFQFEYAGGTHNTNLIPEPGTIVLLVMAGVGFALYFCQKRKR